MIGVLEGLVDRHALANQLAMHPRTVALWAQRRKIPYVKIGKKYFFDPQKVREHLLSQTVEPIKKKARG
jgi:predicted dithiol-disulfide oxidoreductase (DUF899 family)